MTFFKNENQGRLQFFWANKSFFLSLFLHVIVGAIVCANYIVVSGLFILGLIAFVYICAQNNRSKTASYRFFYLSISCVIASMLFKSNSFLYLSVSSALCFVLESNYKRLPNHLFPLLILISPISYYFFETFGFELKLHITQAVVALLHQFNTSISADGNSIIIDGIRFSIDTACMGLRMTGYALCMTLFLHYYYLHDRYFSRTIDVLIFILALLLNIASNFSRILLLVIFQVLPDNPAHYCIGLLCFVFYSIVPLLLIFPRIRKMYPDVKSTKALKAQDKFFILEYLKKVVALQTKYIQLFFGSQGRARLVFQLLLIVLILLSWNIIRQNNTQTIKIKQIPQGFTQKTLANGTIQLQSQNALVYIKPIRSFLSSEHTPTLCWLGSGYEISYVNRCLTNNQQVFYGVLSKHSDKLYTAWWIVYHNHKTINQLEWRKAMLLQNTPCCLVNVTANTPQDLHQAINLFWHITI